MVGPQIDATRVSRPWWIRGPLALMLVWGVLVLPGLSQEQTNTPVKVNYERLLIDPDRGVVHLADTVRVEQEGRFTLRADEVLIWGGRDAMTRPGELYAEGCVRYEREGRTLYADAMYYHFESGRAYVLNLRSRSRYLPLNQDVILRAERLRGVAKGFYTAEDVTLSTCTFGVPHYDVWIPSAELVGGTPRENAGPYEFFPFDDWAIGVSSIIPRYEGIPFLFLPPLSVSYPGIQDFPIRSVRGGQTSRFGLFLYVDWGFRVAKGVGDSLNPWDRSGPEDDDESWLDLVFETDWRQERGGAFGFDPEWDGADYRGYLDTYYLHDDGRSDDSDFDRKFAPLERADRGRARLFHRHELADEWRLEFEASWLSDDDLLEEFFEEEFKVGKEQETVAYLRYRNGPFGGYFLERHRINEFQTQLEYLPKVEGHVVAVPPGSGVGLFDDVRYSLTTHVARLRQRFDEDLGRSSEEMTRIDAWHELRRPIDLGPFVFAPFGGMRNTLFEEDLEDDREYRHIWSAGARVGTMTVGIHDATWDMVGLRGLKHALYADVRFASNVRVIGDSEDVYPFEEVDTYDRFEEGVICLRQRFETKTADGMVHEFLNMGVATEYYPNPRRDTGGNLPVNYMPPFHWITLAPGETGGYDERHWSNLYYDVEFRTFFPFSVRANGQYNPEDDREEVRELRANIGFSPWLSFSFGQTLYRDVSNTVSGSVAWRPEPKWSVLATVSYDYEREDYASRGLRVGRDFHDFILEGNVERSETRDETRFYVTVVPKFMGKRARRTGQSFGEEER